MNIVALIGNVASQPELRYTSAHRAVCSFRLAISRPDGKQADFLTIVTWERQAEVCNEYLAIGRRIGVEGRLHHSTWEAEGTKRSRVEVIASRVQMLGGPRPQVEPTGAPTGVPESDEVAQAQQAQIEANVPTEEPVLA